MKKYALFVSWYQVLIPLGGGGYGEMEPETFQDQDAVSGGSGCIPNSSPGKRISASFLVSGGLFTVAAFRKLHLSELDILWWEGGLYICYGDGGLQKVFMI